MLALVKRRAPDHQAERLVRTPQLLLEHEPLARVDAPLATGAVAVRDTGQHTRGEAARVVLVEVPVAAALAVAGRELQRLAVVEGVVDARLDHGDPAADVLVQAVAAEQQRAADRIGCGEARLDHSPAVVLAQADAAGEIEVAAVVIAAGAKERSLAVARARLRRAGKSGAARLAGDDVDDARGTVGLELGRRVRNHLDLLDVLRRDLQQVVGGGCAGQLRCRSAVDQDRDVAVAAQADVAVAVDLNRRDGAEHVGDSADRALQVRRDRVDLAVDQGFDGKPVGGDDYRRNRAAGRRGRRRGGGHRCGRAKQQRDERHRVQRPIETARRGQVPTTGRNTGPRAWRSKPPGGLVVASLRHPSIPGGLVRSGCRANRESIIPNLHDLVTTRHVRTPFAHPTAGCG